MTKEARKMKKQTVLIMGISIGVLLSGCAKNEAPQKPTPVVAVQPSPTVQKPQSQPLSEEEKQKIREQELKEQQELKETRERVKEQIRKQKEEKRKKEQQQREQKWNSGKTTTSQPSIPKQPSKNPDKIVDIGDKDEERDKGKDKEIDKDKNNEHTKDRDTKTEVEERTLQKDFYTYQNAFEKYLENSKGESLTIEGLTSALGRKIELTGTNPLQLTSSQKNPWGNAHTLELNQQEQKIVLRSLNSTGKTYILATYYVEGNIYSCTDGYEKDNLVLTLPLQKGQSCGGKLG